MFHRLALFPAINRLILFCQKFPQISFVVWLLPLMLFTSGENSLMAHDEALYAWRSRQIVDAGDWVAPWGNAHHKTPGFYWLQAIFFQLFGISDTVARIPSLIAGILNVFVIYEVGKILLGKRLASLSIGILSVEFLWLQYCRLSTPDVTTILLVFLAILSLLKIESHPQYRSVLGFVAGLCFGIGFFMRSFMIFVPAGALLPYLIWEHRRHRHLTNPMLYLGAIIGLIPTLIWFWLSWQRFGGSSWNELFGFAVRLGSREESRESILFYFWNLPLKAFPWFFFGLLGLVLLLRRPVAKYQLILVGIPIALFVELSLVRTRFSHYSLWLYPFIAFLAAVGLDWIAKIYQKNLTSPATIKIASKESLVMKTIKYLPRNLSYALGLLSLLCIVAGAVLLAGGDVKLQEYAILGLVAGLSCLIVPAVWIGRNHLGYKFLTQRYWVGSWLIACWLILATAGCLGLLTDYNPKYRVFFQAPTIASILKSHPVSFVKVDGKNSVLVNFYTPIRGNVLESMAELPANSYAWLYTQMLPESPKPHRIIGAIEDYQLVQVLP
jgi:4-amino-4-deoxy-L-arabinose transferase-like glycosyltransferase